MIKVFVFHNLTTIIQTLKSFLLGKHNQRNLFNTTIYKKYNIYNSTEPTLHRISARGNHYQQEGFYFFVFTKEIFCKCQFSEWFKELTEGV